MYNENIKDILETLGVLSNKITKNIFKLMHHLWNKHLDKTVNKLLRDNYKNTTIEIQQKK